MIRVKSKPDFSKTVTFLKKAQELPSNAFLTKYGELGVLALSSATPVSTGKTAAAWGYTIIRDDDKTRLVWTNDNLTDTNTPIAILIQYGHGTRNGGLVTGYDYINPALEPVVRAMKEEFASEVNRL